MAESARIAPRLVSAIENRTLRLAAEGALIDDRPKRAEDCWVRSVRSIQALLRGAAARQTMRRNPVSAKGLWIFDKCKEP